MDPQYKPIQQQADRLHKKFLDMRDDRNHQLNKWLEVQTREIREDIEQNKAPRSVENRIKEVLKKLEQASSDGTEAISVNHAVTLVNDYEDLRESLRRLPNY